MNETREPSKIRPVGPRTAAQADARRRRDLEEVARELAQEMLLDVEVERLRTVAASLGIEEPDEAEINKMLAAMRHADVAVKFQEVKDE